MSASADQRPPSQSRPRSETIATPDRDKKDLIFAIPPDLKPLVSEWVSGELQNLRSGSLSFDIQATGAALALHEELPALPVWDARKGDDNLEQVTLRILVRLVLTLGALQLLFYLTLGNFQSTHRTRAALGCIQMAELLTGKTFNTGSVLNEFETADLGYTQGVTHLFKILGNSYALLVMPLIAGLELYQASSDWRSRSIVTAAIAQLLWEHKDKLGPKERQSVIWNLYFSLGTYTFDSVAQISHNPSRMVIIKGRSCPRPLSESCCVCKTRYRDDTDIQSTNEAQAIKDTVTLIFDTALHAAQSNPITSKHAIDHFYVLLLELIGSQEESAYDLLSWTVETFFKKQGPKNAEEKTSTTEFCSALSNHFKASPALIRYGSALALLAIGSLQPNFPSVNVHVWNFVVSGVLDSDYLTAGMYLQLLEYIEFGMDTPAVRQTVALVKNEHTKNLS
ncbi:hypothetical protein HDU91_002172, partial [Kappamyces sp. JEL0680]